MKTFSRLLALLALALCAVPVFAQNKVNIFVATGPTAGVYYPLGGGLADVLTKHVPNLNATAGTTDGSMANLLLMGQGKADVGFTMADAGWDAYKGQGKFDGKPINIRALMVLYPNRMHVVTVDGTGITKMSDLKGKRVSTGAPNSATQIMAYRVLEDHSDAVEAMVKKYGPLYVKDTIPVRAYPGQDGANNIATVWNVLVADNRMSDQLAYDIVKTVFERKDDLIRVHAESRNFDYKYQTPGAAVVPFHPGALKYFAEKGVKIN